MHSSDAVDPADAHLHRLLAQIGEHTDDEGMRERIVDLMLTLPPHAADSGAACRTVGGCREGGRPGRRRC
ncbi:hypothetical protein FPZ47_08310 [Mycobacterium helveticum]|jgi:hypothetical protein|uniref:Uncharacterized protein n=1 Tax=Mycobacterium helveticum TaxID=2592811 RepID=A0A557XX81_9MYCO|nr:hypothetical protein [Mycobacterium helveticum]TVS85552.1 hypothetical protein FPZ46_14025 [Mycobacterium helveticum]TVS90714.1 hypothetical protein FPZ47_08310 [Mycobacterium helveticum]